MGGLAWFVDAIAWRRNGVTRVAETAKAGFGPPSWHLRFRGCYLQFEIESSAAEMPDSEKE